MKRLLPYILLLFVFVIKAQTKEIDSLKKQLLDSKISDSTQINLYVTLTKAYFPINIDSTEKFAKISLEKSLKTNKYKIARVYSNLGKVLDVQSKSDSARLYYDKALLELDKNDNKLERSIIYGNYSLSYQNSEKLDLALEYNSKAIELIEDNEDELSRLYFNQAILYLRSGIVDSGKKYLLLAYDSSKKINNTRVEGAVIHTLGYQYLLEEKLDSAKIYFERGLDICKRTKSPEICFRVNSSLGDLYIKMDLLSEASEAILKAKKYATLRNKRYDILLSLIQLGELENKKKNYSKSASYFKEFKAIYEEGEDKELPFEVDAYKLWSDTEFKRANYKKSYELLKQHLKLNDSIFTEKNRELMAEADAKFEAAKKDKELAEQKLAVETKELALQKKNSQYALMTGLAIFFLVASILSWFLFQQRQKRKNQEIITLKREQQVKTLESLMEGEEKERLRIAKELHDGVNVDLSAIKYKLTSLLEKNNEVINEAVAMIDKSCEQVRAISHNLVPPSLKDFSLLEAVEDYCSTMNNIHEPNISFQHIGENINISKQAEANIFRIVQELVNNSIKHADATEIDVQISNRANIIQLTVEDNGKGFNVDKVESKGIGLENIKSRVAYLNAKLDFNSDTKGTSYIIDINTDDLI